MPLMAFNVECMLDNQLKQENTGNYATTQKDKHMTARQSETWVRNGHLLVPKANMYYVLYHPINRKEM